MKRIQMVDSLEPIEAWNFSCLSFRKPASSREATEARRHPKQLAKNTTTASYTTQKNQNFVP